MINECEKIEDQVIDFVCGFLSTSQIESVQEHLGKCLSCRNYWQSLQKEEQSLTGLFANLDANLMEQKDIVINAIERLVPPKQANIISLCRMVVRSSLTKFAGAAVVIGFVALFLIVTLSWINQIKEYIMYAESVV